MTPAVDARFLSEIGGTALPLLSGGVVAAAPPARGTGTGTGTDDRSTARVPVVGRSSSLLLPALT